MIDDLLIIVLPTGGTVLMIVNPMGIIVMYLRGDRALVTGQ